MCCLCQGLKVEIRQQQLTVDFVTVSQSFTGVTASPAADLAEQLGSISCRYQAIASDVSERLKHLNSLQLQWNEYESQVSSLNSWFTEQDTQLDGLMQLQSHAALQECNVCISFLYQA